MAGCRSGRSTTTGCPTGPGKDDQRQVVTSGIRLFRFDGRAGRGAAAGHEPPVRARGRGDRGRRAATGTSSDALMARVQELMDQRSVIRGQVVTFGPTPTAAAWPVLTFVERPTVDAAAVVLPDGVLDRVAHHVIGMGEQRERLLAHGQHLKRGVLLYGPPGTGKTHTVRYLLSASPGHHGRAAERRVAPLHPRRRQGRPRAPAGHRRARGLRPRRRGPLLRDGRVAAALRGARRPRRARLRRRRRLRPHDEPRRGPRGRPGAAARPRRPRRRDPAARRRRPARAAPPLRRPPLRRRGDLGGGRARRGHDGVLRQGARAPGRARGRHRRRAAGATTTSASRSTSCSPTRSGSPAASSASAPPVDPTAVVAPAGLAGVPAGPTGSDRSGPGGYRCGCAGRLARCARRASFAYDPTAPSDLTPADRPDGIPTGAGSAAGSHPAPLSGAAASRRGPASAREGPHRLAGHRRPAPGRRRRPRAPGRRGSPARS